MDKEPIYSRCVSAGTRVYYIDAHKDSKGQIYLSISEIHKDKSPNKKKRQRLFIHKDKLTEFSTAMTDIINQIKNDS